MLPVVKADTRSFGLPNSGTADPSWEVTMSAELPRYYGVGVGSKQGAGDGVNV